MDYTASLPTETYEECIARHGGNENIARIVWEEEESRRKKEFNPDCRFTFAMEMLALQNAGYPFRANDMTIEQWGYIAELKNAIQEKQANDIKKEHSKHRY